MTLLATPPSALTGAGSPGSAAQFGFATPAEYDEIREAVRQIAGKRGLREFSERGRRNEPQTELWNELADAGFMGINVPEEFGGGGAGMSELAVVIEASASVGCPLLLMLVSNAIAVEVLRRHGSVAQQQHWLTELGIGRTKVAFAITEPDAGSNSHNLSTTAKPVDPAQPDGEWTISGQKYYISGVEESAAILLVARTGTDERGRGQLSMFLVPTDAAGLTVNPLPVAAQITDRQYTLFLDDVRVPATAVVGEIGSGLQALFDGLNPERIATAALCIGVGRCALDAASEYARTREVWGKPIGTHQGVAHPLAQAKIDLELAALMLAKAAWLHDNGVPAGEASNMAKAAAADAAVAAVDAAMQTHGGNGMSQEYGLMSLYGMARLLRIAPVSKEMILNYVSHTSLGLPRSY